MDELNIKFLQTNRNSGNSVNESIGYQQSLTLTTEDKMIRRDDALNYHSQGRKGKIEVISTKPCTTQRDLGMAYTPGVADEDSG